MKIILLFRNIIIFNGISKAKKVMTVFIVIVDSQNERPLIKEGSGCEPLN